jgi:hypothetical protein
MSDAPTPDTTVSVDELIRQTLAGNDSSVNLNVTQNSGENLKTKAGSGN